MNREELHDFVGERQPNVCQIACYRDGREVYADEWNGYQRGDACHVMSVTKSVAALLVGVAIDRGLIRSVDQPVMDFFPDYRIKRGEKTLQQVTLRHLLTMTAPYKYRNEPWSAICSSDDWTLAALDYLGGRGGLTGAFRYSTLGVHILTGIIARASGMNTTDFANEYLFAPIGAARHTNYLAQTAAEHKAFTMGKEPKGNVWFCDPQGVGAAGYGLCLSARDMAKIGQMCLQDGLYEGKRIVSSAWVEEMTKPVLRCGPEYGNMAYGFLWWVIDEEQRVYSAIGNSGNVIYVNRPQQIVVAVTSYFKPSVIDRVDFVRRHIEPFVQAAR